MDRDSAIKKIKKCLALAGSSNAHEAAAAMRQAQKLMQEHGVSETDVTLADVSEKHIPAPSNTISSWQASLARSVAAAFGCEHYYCRTAKIGSGYRLVRSTNVVFVGVGAAAEVASYAFEVLLRQATRDRSAHIASQSKKLKPPHQDRTRRRVCDGVGSRGAAAVGQVHRLGGECPPGGDVYGPAARRHGRVQASGPSPVSPRA